MKKHVGIWIDHEKAVIISLQNGDEQIVHIKSDVEKQTRMSGGSRSKLAYGPMDIADERKVERRRKQQLNQYYQDLVQLIRDSDEIFIFGPGEAKIELKKHIESSSVRSAHIVGVESADKMTENQIAAKVKKFYKLNKREKNDHKLQR